MLQTATSCYIEQHLATCSNIGDYVMSSKIKMEKTCLFCGETFTARTTVTKYCSHRCASAAYKMRLKQQKMEQAKKADKEIPFYSEVASKDFLSINEACQLLGVSRWTIYRQINEGNIPVLRMGRRIILYKSDIINQFKKS